MLKDIFHKKYFSYFYFLLLIVCICISTSFIWSVSFWNDEWRGIADVFTHGVNTISYQGKIVTITWGNIGQLLLRGRVLGVLLVNRLLMLSLLDPTLLSLFAVIFHIINSCLVYAICVSITKNRLFSSFAGLFFALSNTHNEVFTWIGAGILTLCSMTGALLTFFILTARIRQWKIYAVVLALLIAFISYELKENTAFLFPFIMVFLYVYRRELKEVSGKILPAIVVSIVLFSLGLTYAQKIQLVNMQVTNISSALGKILFNIVFYPSVLLSQNYIPYQVVMAIRMQLLKIPEYFFLPITETIGINGNLFLFDLLSLALSFLIIFCVSEVYRRHEHLRRIIFFGAVFYIFSFIPVAIRVVTRSNGYITFYYLYYQSFAASIWISCLMVYGTDFFRKKTKIPVVLCVAVFYFIFLIYENITGARTAIVLGSKSKQFIRSFKQLNITVPNKPIFYVQSNTAFSLGGITTRLPFMLGSGFILSILNYQSGNIPSELLDQRYLEPFDSVGYMEIKEKGYGFFWNYADLKKEFTENPKLTPDQVIGLHYNFDGNLVDITKEVRTELQK